MNIAEASEVYGRLGYKIFPVKPLDKHPPLVKDWPNLATDDLDQIRHWWKMWPNANIAMHCADMAVIDSDGNAAWPVGHIDIWSDLLEKCRVKTNTPRPGGLHFWFRMPIDEDPIKNSVGQPFLGLDIRTTRGYVIVPPSKREIGPYVFVGGDPVPSVSFNDLQVIPRTVLRWIRVAQGEIKGGKQGRDTYQRLKEDPLTRITAGNRNITLFKIGSYLRRIGGSENSIRAYLRSENQVRCDPPMDPAEIDQIAHSAYDRYKTNQLAQADVEGWEQAMLDGHIESPTEDPGNVPQRAFKTAQPNIQRFVEWATRVARRPQPELAIGAAVSVMLAMGSRKVFSVGPGGKTSSNGYVILLAGSAEGKETPRSCANKLLRAGGPHNERLIGPENFTSPAAIFRVLEESGGRTFCSIDEFGRIFQSWTSAQADASGAANNKTAMLSLYSHALVESLRPRGYANQERDIELHYPHLNILGASVPDYVWSAIGSEGMSDGVLGRMHFFESSGKIPKFQRVPEDDQPDPELVWLSQAWDNFSPAGYLEGEDMSLINPNMQPWRFTEEAETLFEYWVGQTDLYKDKSPKHVQGIWARAPERANKLILASAIAHGPAYGRIDYDDVAWGTSLEEHLTRRMIFKTTLWVSRSSWEAEINKVIRTLEGYGGQLTVKQFNNTTRHLKPVDRELLKKDILSSGDAHLRTHRGKNGRPQVHWVLGPEPQDEPLNGQIHDGI